METSTHLACYISHAYTTLWEPVVIFAFTTYAFVHTSYRWYSNINPLDSAMQINVSVAPIVKGNQPRDHGSNVLPRTYACGPHISTEIGRIKVLNNFWQLWGAHRLYGSPGYKSCGIFPHCYNIFHKDLYILLNKKIIILHEHLRRYINLPVHCENVLLLDTIIRLN